MASTAAVSEALDGLNFPADKQKIIDYAQKKNAPQDVMDTLHKIPDHQYNSMAGVWEAVGKVT